MLKFYKIHIRKRILTYIGFWLILFSSNASFSSEDALLLALNIECSGKNNDWTKSWSDNFFAISTPYTLQGSRYWIASGADEGDKKYNGDIGQNIFIGINTKKDFRIKGEGTWLKNKGDIFKFKFLSKGNKSIIEHLSAGVEGTGGKGKHKRECIIKLLSQVDAFDGIRVDKYLSVRDKKIKKLLSEINDYKNIQRAENSNQETVLNSENNNEEINVITKEFNKQIELLEKQISKLKKEKDINENKIIKLTNDLASNDSELDYKSKFKELSLQFESLKDELENITKINEQLGNEISSLKNNNVNKNISEKENKKIVQKKNEEKSSDHNQEKEKKNIETVSLDIVKDEELINLDIADLKKLKTKEIEEILYDTITFGFYTDGALFESQYSPNSKGNEGQFSISFSENEKYTGVYKVTKSKVCFLLDGTDNWECSLIYKKNKNDKIYYWATKGEIFAKTSHILTKSEYAKIDKNNIFRNTKDQVIVSEDKKEEVKNETLSNERQLTSIDIDKLNLELDFLSNERILMNDPHTTLTGIPDSYLNFNNKELVFEGEEFKQNGKNCGRVFVTLNLNSDKTGSITWTSESCDSYFYEKLGVWRSDKHFIAFAYLSVLNDGTTGIFVNNYKINFHDLNYASIYVERHDNIQGKRQTFGMEPVVFKNFKDLNNNKMLPLGRDEIDYYMYQEALLVNFENKTKLFGVKLMDNPDNYEISNKRLGEEFVLYGNSLTEIFDADYGQKLEFNFYDTEPPIKNNSFFDYKIRTTSLNGKEIISSINAIADCPLKGLEGCTEFSDQISNTLFEKYGFVSDTDFDIIDENGNIYTLSLSMLFTQEGEIIVSGYDYLNADGLWISLGINWSEESLMSKFEIDPESKKKLDTNF